MRNKKLSDMEYEVVKQHSTLAVWYLMDIVDYMKNIGNMDTIKMYLNKILDSNFLEMNELINEHIYTHTTRRYYSVMLSIKGLCCVSVTLANYAQYDTLSSLEILIKQVAKASYIDLERYEKILLKVIK